MYDTLIKRSILLCLRHLTQELAGITGLTISCIHALNNGLPNIVFAGVNGMGGVVIGNAQDVLVENSDMQLNAFSGFLAYEVTKLTIDNCHCDDNSDSLLFGAGDGAIVFAAGASIIPNVGANDIVIRKSTFNKCAALAL